MTQRFKQVELVGAGPFTADFEWPAGAAAIRLIVDGEEQFNTDNGSDRLFPLQRVMDGPVFSATDATVQVTATYERPDGWSVAATFVERGSDMVSLDSLDSLS